MWRGRGSKLLGIPVIIPVFTTAKFNLKIINLQICNFQHFLRVSMNRRAEAQPKEVFKVDQDKIHNFLCSTAGSGQLDMNKIGQIEEPFGGNNFRTFMFQQVRILRTILISKLEGMRTRTSILGKNIFKHFSIIILWRGKKIFY